MTWTCGDITRQQICQPLVQQRFAVFIAIDDLILEVVETVAKLCHFVELKLLHLLKLHLEALAELLREIGDLLLLILRRILVRLQLAKSGRQCIDGLLGL